MSSTHPFSCKWQNGGRSYTRSNHLTVHQRSHTGDKPYPCRVDGCTKSSSRAWDRRRHERTHEKRWFECYQDGNSFLSSRRRAPVMHRRKTHKQGKTPNHTDNCSQYPYDSEPSATPQHSPMTSSPHVQDYMDLDSQNESPNWLRFFHNLPDSSQDHDMLQLGDNRQNPNSVPGYYHGIFKQTQLVFQEDAVTQHTYGVSGTGHPGVVMMTVPAQDELSEPFQQLSMNHPYAASGAATPVPNPWFPDSLYTHGLSFQTENMSSIPGVSGSQHSPIASGQDPFLQAQQKQYQWQSYSRPNRNTTLGQLSEDYGSRGLMYEREGTLLELLS